MIRERMQNGIARLQNCQIMDLARVKQEFFLLNGEELIPASLGKNAKALLNISDMFLTLLTSQRPIG